MKFYDWQRTLSYDAPITMVVTMRGKGKTYGLRKQCINDFINHGYASVEICRYREELAAVASGYFDRVSKEKKFADYVFRTDSKAGYIAKKPKDDEKPKWQLCVYFVALTQMQRLKKNTFNNVKRIIFDEFIIDTSDRYHRYLNNEFELLANMVDTCTRQTANSTIEPKLYLLGNALDLVNPYFIHFGVKDIPANGYTWLSNKLCLLHFLAAGNDAQEKVDNTLAGRMLAKTQSGQANTGNKFVDVKDDFIAKKSSNALCKYSIKFRGRTLGFWQDEQEGYLYVTNRATEDVMTYSLTLSDNSIDTVALDRASARLASLKRLHYSGVLRYQNYEVQKLFLDLLVLLGVK